MEAAELAKTRTRVAMVVPPRALVVAFVTDVRATPGDDAELVDQLHYGEMPALLTPPGEWRYVQADDHYFGWIRGRDLTGDAYDDDDERLVAVPMAALRREPTSTAEIVGYVPAGSGVPRSSERYDTDRIKVLAPAPAHGEDLASVYLSAADTVAVAELPHRAPTVDDLIATAEAFLGVPYLWGGTTGIGLDCSGFVQQVYRLNGLRLDRDADQQAMEGRPVDVPARGDLVFFGRSRVTHVGLARDERTMLNALGGKKVQVDDIAGIGVGVLAIRRYLP